ncbi:transcription termination/antitermination protein NusG [Ruegeria sp. HKCCD8929]|uniref:transcription termination/antitermination protein NusG n=1 Tax=Ruegeria sp. HKCCD8929 TaxID=2683006 RepID=UPI0014891878|nr:transcription termination/antitermination NusG family protein [Ruegeria sp. HKCCD8929]
MNERVSPDAFRTALSPNRINGGRNSGAISDSENWFVAQLRRNGRLLAERNLVRQGYKPFCPSRLETLRVRGRHKTEARPLFPGYLFVQFDPKLPGWHAINSTRGVARLVLNNSQNPRPLPAPFMAGLLARCDRHGLFTPNDELADGDRIRVLSGPFADIVATVERLDTNARLEVLISLMGRDVRTTVSRGIVQRLESQSSG